MAGQTTFAGYDNYDGGTGAVQLGKSGSSPDVDTLYVYLSNDQLNNAAFMSAFQAEWAQYQNFITANTNTQTQQAGQAVFTFTTINLKGRGG